MLSGGREAGCFREVAALHSDHLLDRFHCTYNEVVIIIMIDYIVQCAVKTKSPKQLR